MSFTVKEILFYERPVKLRLPFKFGVVTLTEAPQAFVRARIEDSKGRSAWGSAAELLAPKWFDKNTALSNEDNFAQLRRSLRLARDAYLASSPASAFDLFAANYPQHIERCAAAGLNQLIASFGPALLDRAVLDALCRLEEVSFYRAMQSNLPQIDLGRIAPDMAPGMAGFDMAGFLSRLQPSQAIHARHTVGLVDPLSSTDVTDKPIADGLPETLEQVLAVYGHRYFKIKVGGKLDEDIDRLCRISAVLDTLTESYFVSLDGNEQYTDVEVVLELWQALVQRPELDRFRASVLFIEQPIARSHALSQDVRALAALKPVIIDESDADLDSFVQARELGYSGVSSKNCKGVYRSLLNAARCAQWNAATGNNIFFMSGEDLTTQAGLSVQQDLATVCLLGLSHVERNGHHYVDGFGNAPEHEAWAFLAEQPGLYHLDNSRVRLRIRNGLLDTRSLDQPGYAHTAEPDWASMAEMI